MATLTWQMRINRQWHDCDLPTSSLMEAAFGVPSTVTVKLPFSVGVVPSSSILADFDLNRMTFGDLPVRRSKGDDPDGSVEYWDDYSYVSYNKFTTNLVIDAIRNTRPSVAFYVNDDLYTIDLGQGMKRISQLNASSGRHRPLLVELPSAVYGQDADDVEELDISADADQVEGIPAEFFCPITMAIMTTPVVAADGNTYDKKAIQRWMLTKRTSPVTGVQLMHTDLIVNRALRKLISDTCCLTESAPAEGEISKRKSSDSLADEVGGSSSSHGKKKMKSVAGGSKKHPPAVYLCMMCDKPRVANEHMVNPNVFVHCDSCGMMMHVQCFVEKASPNATALYQQGRIMCTTCDETS